MAWVSASLPVSWGGATRANKFAHGTPRSSCRRPCPPPLKRWATQHPIHHQDPKGSRATALEQCTNPARSTIGTALKQWHTTQGWVAWVSASLPVSWVRTTRANKFAHGTPRSSCRPCPPPLKRWATQPGFAGVPLLSSSAESLRGPPLALLQSSGTRTINGCVGERWRSATTGSRAAAETGARPPRPANRPPPRRRPAWRRSGFALGC